MFVSSTVFQVVSQPSEMQDSTHVDAFKAMALLRWQLSTVNADDLIKSMHRDPSGKVSLSDFKQFLNDHGVRFPPGLAAAVYESLHISVGGPVSYKDVLLCIALISRSPVANPAGLEYNNLCQVLGQNILKSGWSLVDFFLGTDRNKDGFLSIDELERVFLKGPGQHYTPQEMSSIMLHMDAQGNQDGVVSLIEFLRAIGPRELSYKLSHAMLQEYLRPLYLYDAGLVAFLQRCDYNLTGKVDVSLFKLGMEEVIRQMVAAGDAALTPTQVDAICEIASGGTGMVQYRWFMQSLQLRDTEITPLFK